MFSKAVVGSAKFLKMPIDSQNLYFHLGMSADDDGVVEAWSILKTTGSSEDNLRVLAAKGFITVLNEDLVSYILDWNEHNELRADRLIPSQYRELLVQMVPDVQLKEPKRRADLRPLLPGRPMDNQRTEEDRLGKDRLISAVATAPRRVYVPRFSGEYEEVEENPRTKKPPKYPNAKTVFSWFPSPQKSWQLNTTELKHAELLFERGEEEVKKRLRYIKNHEGEDFLPSITKPSDLERKWNDLTAYAKRNS